MVYSFLLYNNFHLDHILNKILMKTNLQNFRNLSILIEDQNHFQISQYNNLYHMFLEHQLQKNLKIKLHKYQYYYYFSLLKSFFEYSKIFAFPKQSNQHIPFTIYLLLNIFKVYLDHEILQNNVRLNFILNQIYLYRHNQNQILIKVNHHLTNFLQTN